jgi:hypothetical protein
MVHDIVGHHQGPVKITVDTGKKEYVFYASSVTTSLESNYSPYYSFKDEYLSPVQSSFKYSMEFTVTDPVHSPAIPIGDDYYVTLPEGFSWQYDKMTDFLTLRYKDHSYDISKYMLETVGGDDVEKIIYQACRSLYLMASEKKFESAWEKGYKKFKKPLNKGGPLPSLGSYPASNNYSYLQTSFKELIFDKGDKSIHRVAVPCPEGCKRETFAGIIPTKPLDRTVYDMIQHLNDFHRWDRATKIADWLDKLHDEGIIDITITSPDPDKA